MASHQIARKETGDEGRGNRGVEAGKKNERKVMEKETKQRALKEEGPEKTRDGSRKGGDEGSGMSLEEISQYRQKAQQNSVDAIRAAEERFATAKQRKETKEDDVGNKETKKGFLAGEGKETASSPIEKSSGEQVPGVRDKVVDVGKNAASFTGEKMAVVKDSAIGTAESAASFVGKVATSVKETALVAGWGTAEYGCHKAAEGTEAAAHVAQAVSGYVGEKAVAAKDVVAEGGKSAIQFAGRKVAAVKDSIVSAEESAAEFAARKKAEARGELEGFKSSKSEPGRGSAEETTLEEAPATRQTLNGEEMGKGGQGLLQAIGETILEIAQTTKQLVIGGDDPIETGNSERLARQPHEEGN